MQQEKRQTQSTCSGPIWKSVLKASIFLSKPLNQVLGYTTCQGGPGKLEGAKNQGYEVGVLYFSHILTYTDTWYTDTQSMWPWSMNIHSNQMSVVQCSLSHSSHRDMLRQVKSAWQSKFYRENIELDLNTNHDGKKTSSARSLAMSDYTYWWLFPLG